MNDWLEHSGRPRLLVSVRDAGEALAALAGGADVIDVKEPARGPLGPADAETIAAVVRAVAGRCPVTAAAGELALRTRKNGWHVPEPQAKGVPDEGCPRHAHRPELWACHPAAGVALVKMGLAGCGSSNDWLVQWRQIVECLPNNLKVAAVVYADWPAANAPQPRDVLAAAVESRCPALLIDTWNKSAGALFEHWRADELQRFVDHVHEHAMAIALAGSLSIENVRGAAALGPDFIAVRGAACEGGRNGTISHGRVRVLRQVLDSAGCSAAEPPDSHATSAFRTISNPISRII